MHKGSQRKRVHNKLSFLSCFGHRLGNELNYFFPMSTQFCTTQIQQMLRSLNGPTLTRQFHSLVNKTSVCRLYGSRSDKSSSDGEKMFIVHMVFVRLIVSDKFPFGFLCPGSGTG